MSGMSPGWTVYRRPPADCSEFFSTLPGQGFQGLEEASSGDMRHDVPAERLPRQYPRRTVPGKGREEPAHDAPRRLPAVNNSRSEDTDCDLTGVLKLRAVWPPQLVVRDRAPPPGSRR